MANAHAQSVYPRQVLCHIHLLDKLGQCLNKIHPSIIEFLVSRYTEISYRKSCECVVFFFRIFTFSNANCKILANNSSPKMLRKCCESLTFISHFRNKIRIFSKMRTASARSEIYKGDISIHYSRTFRCICHKVIKLSNHEFDV